MSSLKTSNLTSQWKGLYLEYIRCQFQSKYEIDGFLLKSVVGRILKINILGVTSADIWLESFSDDLWLRKWFVNKIIRRYIRRISWSLSVCQSRQPNGEGVGELKSGSSSPVESWDDRPLWGFGLVCWVLWHINLCRLSNAKSIFM